MLFDAITAGDPLYSLTGTQETVETLKRHTGPADVVLYGPRALGEVLQWPGMVGALGGVVLGFAFLRRRSALGIAAAVLALGAFALLGAAGLAIIARYTMLAAAILAIFVALALLGWRLLEPGHRWRRGWQLFAALVALMFLAWLPNQWDLDSRVDTDLTNQARIETDLTDLVDAGAFEPLCGKIAVPNHRAIPRLAFGLDVKPTADRQRQRGRHPPSWLLRRAGQRLRDPQLHPRPQRPDRLQPRRSPRLPRSRLERLLAGLPPLLSTRSRRAAASARSRGGSAGR